MKPYQSRRERERRESGAIPESERGSGGEDEAIPESERERAEEREGVQETPEGDYGPILVLFREETCLVRASFFALAFTYIGVSDVSPRDSTSTDTQQRR